MLLGPYWIDSFLFIILFSIFIYVFAVNQITTLHKTYLAFHFLMMLWPLSQIVFHHAADEIALRDLSLLIGLMSLLALGPGWLLFTRLLTQQSYSLPHSTIYKAIAPVVVITFLMSIYPELWLTILGSQGQYYRYGPFFVLYVMVCAVYFVLAAVLMLRTIRTSPSATQRKQLSLLMLGMLIFIVFTLADLVNNVITYFPGQGRELFGLTSLGILLSDICFVFVIQRYRVLEIVSIARREVVDTMKEGIIVVDDDDIVLDVNRGMDSFLSVHRGEQLNMKIVVRQIPDPVEADRVWTAYYYNRYEAIETEICIETSQSRYVSLHIFPILDDKKTWVGRLLTFHDVTELRHLLDEMNHKNRILFERNQELVHIQQELRTANRKLEHMAVTDVLTACYNRRYLMQRLETDVVIHTHSRTPFSLILFDIDHFKRINDTYGHLIGDRVLRLIAEVVRSVLRGTDLLARYGGEEFIVYLPYAHGGQAQLVARRIVEAIEHQSIVTDDGDPIIVTVSMGWISYEGEETEMHDPQAWVLRLIEQADRALYQAKQRGRNCIVAANSHYDEVAPTQSDT
ncbi:histidine kinase N-terminal 7TM domain-containing diguanylate cyclase [Paenibacillus sp. 481]|uniref:histidine kinase N-terminal 7TM domain-containing diguanylate cyclase n=1 Tax=Paenibacillus sp. 481 TaxID=2835869 RepID=UPI001E6195D6|nr:diguanylate cyclase [Paenibacillus sp. 481]UHA74755.1 diguanylate cyclase [Paenibacillus sp. 481]